MMPIAARQDRSHYSNLFSVHYSEGNIFNVTSETLFKELSQFSYQLYLMHAILDYLMGKLLIIRVVGISGPAVMNDIPPRYKHL